MFYTATSPAIGRRFAGHPAQRMLERLIDQASQSQPKHKVDVEQDESATTLRFDVPGIARDQLSIGIEDNVVRIQSLEGAPRNYKMAYELPQDIAVDSSSAKLENGVLTLRLAKQTPVSRVTELAIH